MGWVEALIETLQAWTDEGVPIARAVVIRTFGSSPRREGATMLRASDGRISGSVSGGCVETPVYHEMIDLLEGGLPRVLHFGITEDMIWDVGLACGGTIDVLVQPSIPAPALEAVSATSEGPMSQLSSRTVW